ncbi:saccharopine dehydrogenase NADP-binding domain-containing protein [Dermatophilaceae bacterium Sec6.4]
MATPRDQRDLDIVLFGATGFVGKLTAEHLAAHAPAGLRIGLAGRNAAKVRDVRTSLGPSASDWELIAADSSDPASLAALADRARVVITTVGPYAKYGMPLVQACAEAGTDYVDLTGEVLFVRESIDLFHNTASASGARIVHSCGFDSVPSDLAVLNLAEQVAADGAGTPTDTTLFVTMKGGASGGTLDSMKGQIDQIRTDKAKRMIALDKFALSPDRSAEPKGEWRDSMSVHYSPEVKSWTGPFVMASYNTRIVRRSNALRGHDYGPTFRYREVQRAGDGLSGRATAYGLSGGLAAGFGALSIPLLRPLVNKVLPKAGEGPSAQARAKGFFKVDARTTTTDGSQYRSVVAAQGDPGYAATCVMLAEAALALATQREQCPLPEGINGGVLTPATALGDVLSTRLRDQGFTIRAERLNA